MIGSFPQFVTQEVCLSCEGCCRFQASDSCWRPKLLKREQFPEFKGRLTDEGILKTLPYKEIQKCIFFYESDNICKVYPMRPFECHLYPFLLVKKGENVGLSVHLACPYVQDHRGDKEFEDYVEYLKKFFLEGEAKELLRDYTRIANDYLEHEEEIEDLYIFS